MSDACSQVTTCTICQSNYGRFRCKTIVTLSKIEAVDDTFTFNVEGMGSTVYQAKWGLPDICPYGAPSLPINANSTVSVYLSETYMSDVSPKIPWGASDIKHPGSLPNAEYQNVRVAVSKAMLTFVFSENMTVPLTVELSDQVQLTGALSFGSAGSIACPPAIAEELRSKFPAGTDVARLLAGQILILDVHLQAKLPAYLSDEVKLSLFNRQQLHWKPGPMKTVRSGVELELELHTDYLRKLQSSARWKFESLARESASERISVERSGSARHREALAMIEEGLMILRSELLGGEEAA